MWWLLPSHSLSELAARVLLRVAHLIDWFNITASPKCGEAVIVAGGGCQLPAEWVTGAWETPGGAPAGSERGGSLLTPLTLMLLCKNPLSPVKKLKVTVQATSILTHGYAQTCTHTYAHSFSIRPHNERSGRIRASLTVYWSKILEWVEWVPGCRRILFPPLRQGGTGKDKGHIFDTCLWHLFTLHDFFWIWSLRHST